jgi:hypothetical protein
MEISSKCYNKGNIQRNLIQWQALLKLALEFLGMCALLGSCALLFLEVSASEVCAPLWCSSCTLVKLLIGCALLFTIDAPSSPHKQVCPSTKWCATPSLDAPTCLQAKCAPMPWMRPPQSLPSLIQWCTPLFGAPPSPQISPSPLLLHPNH